MVLPIRVLGIAPYAGMKTVFEDIQEEYPMIDLTILDGDMEQGLEAARNNFHGDYDAIISRGGTAKILRENLPMPVIEIEISMYDVLCALKLADKTEGKAAIVTMSDSVASVQDLCALMEYDLGIFPIDSAEAVEPTLRKLQEDDYKTILCDVLADTTAKRLGLNSILITSGAASIRKAFDQVLTLCRGQARLREENLFFRELISGQLSRTVVFDRDGNVFLSSLHHAHPEIVEMLRRELPESLKSPERRMTRNLGGMLYTIRSRQISAEGAVCVAFFVDARKTPISPNQVGIRFFTRPEAEQAYYDSIFSFAGATFSAIQDVIDQMSHSSAPVMVCGEDGTGKEPVVSALYLRSNLQNNSFISVNCRLLNEKSWTFLLEHHSSPLTDQDCMIFFANIDVLPEERRRQLLAILSEMDVCRRNRIVFSCVCRPGEYMSEAASLFADKLCCLTLHLTPLRQLADQIPALVNLSISHLNADMPHQLLGAEPEAVELLQKFQWPHNYTQFRRVLGELVVTATGRVISAESVRQVLRKERHVGVFETNAENVEGPLDLSRTMEEINQDIAIRVVREANGNQTAAAKRLGISRTTLWRLLQK